MNETVKPSDARTSPPESAPPRREDPDDSLAKRAILVVVGLGLIVLGVALGVSVVLLPVGVVVGISGLGLVFLGLFMPAFRSRT